MRSCQSGFPDQNLKKKMFKEVHDVALQKSSINITMGVAPLLLRPGSGPASSREDPEATLASKHFPFFNLISFFCMCRTHHGVQNNPLLYLTDSFL